MPTESIPHDAAASPGPAEAAPACGPASSAPFELTLALRLVPQAQGLGCGWHFSLHSGDQQALHCDSFAGLVSHLARLIQSLPPPAAPHRGIR